ncbi:MAG: hypothetical protein BGO09_00125 [Bacteroidetes bacterium 47-18]|nr:MAG: hypothetical protein BGO09_00125 [Bacteroidetes bacterium 47-18]
MHEAELHYYKARGCEGCPMRGMCHKSIAFGVMELVHNLSKWAKRRITEQALPQRPTSKIQNLQNQLPALKLPQYFAIAV